MDVERALSEHQRATIRDVLALVATTGLPEPLLVGATAIRLYLPDDVRQVASRDQDLAALVGSWEELDALARAAASAFDVSRADDGRWVHRTTGVPVDLVPFGPIEAPVGFVQMRRSSQRLSAVGLREAWERAEVIDIDGHPLRVPTLPFLLMLKLTSWAHRQSPKDLEDAERILGVMPESSEDPLSDVGLLEHMAEATLTLDDVDLWFAARGLDRHLGPETRRELRRVVDRLYEADFGVRAPMRRVAPSGDDVDEQDETVRHQLRVLRLAFDDRTDG